VMLAACYFAFDDRKLVKATKLHLTSGNYSRSVLRLESQLAYGSV
jgi:hypothetical protein